MKRFSLIIVLVLALFLLAGCVDEIPEPVVSKAPVVTDAPPVQEAYPVSVDGETFNSAPATVASLSPSITAILYDIGAQERLVGVSDYCDWPPAVEGISRIGSPAKPDIDALVALAPELLITCSPIAATDILMLEQVGTRVLKLSSPKSYAELYDLYIKLSLIFNGTVDGMDTANAAMAPLDELMVTAQSMGISKTFVVVENYAQDGLMLSPPYTFSSDILSVFGENIWRGESYTVTDDELFEIGPDVVFYAAGLDKDDIKKTFPHSQLIEIDFNRFERPSIRVMEVVSDIINEIDR